MEGVYWYTHQGDDSIWIIAEFDQRSRRIRFGRAVKLYDEMVGYAVEQLTISIKEARAASAARVAYAELH